MSFEIFISDDIELSRHLIDDCMSCDRNEK